jgi:RNA polymerase sigma factor (TIGR02999 family)
MYDSITLNPSLCATLPGIATPFSATSRPLPCEQGNVTAILRDIGADVPQAIGRLFSVLYDELYRVAQSRLRSQGAAPDLSATSLLHDTYERLVRVKQLELEDRQQFFRYAATVMRTVVVDLARARLCERRGGDAIEMPLDTMLSESISTPIDASIVRLNDALSELERADARLAQVVELRFFGGLGVDEVADVLGVNSRTVGRDWNKAKAMLAGIMANDS